MSGTRGPDSPSRVVKAPPRPAQGVCPGCAEVPVCGRPAPQGQRCARCAGPVAARERRGTIAGADDATRAAWVRGPVVPCDPAPVAPVVAAWWRKGRA